MKKITDYISKPSEALQAMVDGLINQSKRTDFQVNMSTFGYEEKGICFGCAATCAIQQITGVNLTAENIGDGSFSDRQDVIGIEYHSLDCFENAINTARIGMNLELFSFFGLGHFHENEFEGLFDMNNENWRKELPKVKKLIAKLKEKGL